MPQDFSRQNLQGRSFKGQNLTDANFSYADIRGADFTNALLNCANFSYAKAGLQRHWAIFWVSVSFFLAALSALTSVSANGILRVQLSNPVFEQNALLLALLLLGLLSIFVLIAARQGLTVVAAALASTLVVAGIVATAGSAVALWNDTTVVSLASGLGGSLTVAVGTAGVITGTIAVVGIVTEQSITTVVMIVALIGGILGAIIRVLVRGGGEALFSTSMGLGNWAVLDLVWAWGWAWGVAFLGSFMGWRTVKGDDNFSLIRKVAIALASIGGTSFRNANLTEANFTSAKLKNTDFRKAILIRTRWYQAQQLDRARVGDSILNKTSIIQLLTTGNGYKKSYIHDNLSGANLAGANLNEANFKEAELNDATLEAANLEDANLTQVQAIGTNFRKAYLTGACLEAWNIDATTNLEQVDCRYVYLLQQQQERRPSSGEFQAGEFTKLFQEVLNTVDLIFRNGVDWKAFIASFQKLQIDNAGTELAIQSIENKGDGCVVVKVNVDPDTNKAKIHQDFTHHYELALQAIEEKYQTKLESKDELIASYRQQLDDYRHRERQLSADMGEIINLLSSKPMNVPVNIPEVKAIAKHQSRIGKLVILTFAKGDFEQGFSSIIAQIWTEGERLPTQWIAQLPPAPEISELYCRWQIAYQSLGLHPRLEFRPSLMGNFSKNDVYILAEELEEKLNQWLNSELFRPISQILREKFMRSDEVPFIVQSENPDVRKLPWHLWDFFKPYRKAEVALSTPFYDRVDKLSPPRTKLRILSILGDSVGINVEKDRKILENLNNAEIVFLVEPSRQTLDCQLWDEQGWDILCFSGHTSSQWDRNNGWICINPTDKLTINQLENALKTAIERGLQLAIFNSCDGLGLARQLADLHIPQMIVMRESVPDLVAQEFLKNFLSELTRGKSFYVAVRQARERLQGLEDTFPCATWLPVICQNPAEVPMQW
jgi:uncharacterized protein YjbI with pentapeptide repeats